MAGYIGRAIEHYGVPIYSSVIYLRPDAGQRDPGQYLQAHPDRSPLRVSYGTAMVGLTLRSGLLSCD